jgi:hypothetical protein
MNPVLPAALVLAVFSAGAAFAQTGTSNPATSAPVLLIPSAAATSAPAPVAGANSFTESEARHRIEAQGYTGVTMLQKDDQSIWRGKAMKDGKSVDVALDYQGNIVVQ